MKLSFTTLVPFQRYCFFVVGSFLLPHPVRWLWYFTSYYLWTGRSLTWLCTMSLFTLCISKLHHITLCSLTVSPVYYYTSDVVISDRRKIVVQLIRQEPNWRYVSAVRWMKLGMALTRVRPILVSGISRYSPILVVIGIGQYLFEYRRWYQ